jgi:hypothetical protein
MKLFSEPRMWIPLAGLGITLALAPQSRAQADAAPDNFEVAYSATPALPPKFRRQRPGRLSHPRRRPRTRSTHSRHCKSLRPRMSLTPSDPTPWRSRTSAKRLLANRITNSVWPAISSSICGES